MARSGWPERRRLGSCHARRTAAACADPDPRPAARRAGAGPRRRVGPAAGPAAAVAPGRAALRRPQGRPPAPGDGVRRDPGAHREPRAGDAARDAPSTTLLAEPFGNWHVETTDRDAAAAGDQEARGDGRVTRRRAAGTVAAAEPRAHDRAKPRLLPEDDPVLAALGISDAQGRVKPSRQAKYRQVEEFLRAARRRSSTTRVAAGAVRTPTPSRPAAGGRPRLRQRLPHVRRAPLPRPRARAAGPPTGVDVKAQSREHNTAVAAVARARRPDVVRAGRHRHASSSTSAPTWCWRCTPATPPPTTRWPARSRWDAPLVLAAPVLPPRRRGAAAPDADPGAVRPAHAARHPARAVRRHPDRRAAGRSPAAARLPRRRRRVRRQPAHPAQHAAAGGPHRRRAVGGAGAPSSPT